MWFGALGYEKLTMDVYMFHVYACMWEFGGLLRGWENFCCLPEIRGCQSTVHGGPVDWRAILHEGVDWTSRLSLGIPGFSWSVDWPSWSVDWMGEELCTRATGMEMNKISRLPSIIQSTDEGDSRLTRSTVDCPQVNAPTGLNGAKSVDWPKWISRLMCETVDCLPPTVDCSVLLSLFLLWLL